MTPEQRTRFKELFARFGYLDGQELHEFALLTLVVPINIKTGAIPSLDEVTQELRSAAD